MSENFKTTRYNNGKPILNAANSSQWENNTNGAYSIYNNAYGFLYNWFAVNNDNGICPEGWRVPIKEEWNELINYLRNYDNIISSNVGNRLKSCRQVNSPLGGECDTDAQPRWNTDELHFGRDQL